MIQGPSVFEKSSRVRREDGARQYDKVASAVRDAGELRLGEQDVVAQERTGYCTSLRKGRKIGGNTSYAGKGNRDFCKEKNIQTSFAKRGRPSKIAKEKDFVKHF